MKTYRLHFLSSPKGPYGRDVPFSMIIEAESEADARLIGDRMRAEGSWSFIGVEPEAD